MEDVDYTLIDVGITHSPKASTLRPGATKAGAAMEVIKKRKNAHYKRKAQAEGTGGGCLILRLPG